MTAPRIGYLDRTEGSEVDQYERRQLRTRFNAVIHAYG